MIEKSVTFLPRDVMLAARGICRDISNGLVENLVENLVLIKF